MHGYQAVLELERREIHDWANVSRPQVYYSPGENSPQRGTSFAPSGDGNSRRGGPERSTFENDEGWPESACGCSRTRRLDHGRRDHPPFLTWMGAFSWQARPGVFRSQLKRRRTFLPEKKSREKKKNSCSRFTTKVGSQVSRGGMDGGFDGSTRWRAEVRWTHQLERGARATSEEHSLPTFYGRIAEVKLRPRFENPEYV